MLRDLEIEYLRSLGLTFSIYKQGSLTLLVLEGYELPDGYTPQVVDILIVIPSEYPDAKLDMWWVYPHVVFTRTRQAPANTPVRTAYPGFTPDPARQWQRFSRHPKWRAGVDDLRSFLRALRSTLEREVGQVAA